MTDKKEEINQLLDHLFRHESGKLVSILTRIFGTENIDLAEDVVQDSLIEAISQWAFKGIPENPTGWLYRVSKNKAINALGREKHKRKYASKTADSLASADPLLHDFFSEQEIADDQLRMIFTCCHPSISADSQIALTLKTLCGFSIQEIAKAFLTSEENIHKRLVRARQKLREGHVVFEVPNTAEIEQRLGIVLQTIYLLFNEGYSASTGTDVVRFELCLEAVRLTEMMAEHGSIQHKSGIFALLALMQLNASRFSARQTQEGNILTLAEQDRSLWNQLLIQKGLQNLEKSTSENYISIYHILAAISAYHCVAPNFESTDWKSILSLYDNLLTLDNSPVVLLNRAIALSKVNGAAIGITALESILESPSLQSSHLFFLTQAEMYFELGNFTQATGFFERAGQLANLPAEKELVKKRLKSCQEKLFLP